MKKLLIIVSAVILILSACTKTIDQDLPKKGNVIFIHPDGTALANWHALRILESGPDGELNWDKLPNTGLYRSHLLNSLTASSNAGGTVHAYGVKADYDSYGLIGGSAIQARSGNKMSIMQEAMRAGIKTGLINSGSIIEPGSGVFVSTAEKRSMYESIARQIIESGVDVILSGGEEWLLPEGEEGTFGTGLRKDGLNLIEWAKSNGYVVVYNKEQLLNVPADTKKLLGVFAKIHTFNDKSEEEQREKGLPHYNPEAPSIGEMLQAAIDILSKDGKQFFIVAEEEGTDNFGNKNNASGMLAALKRSDDAIGVALNYLKKNKNTQILVAADSEASGMELMGGTVDRLNPDEPLPPFDKCGAPIDGIGGTETKPFISAPDKRGNRLPFYILWNTPGDVYGSVIAKAAGLHADMVKGSFDNTEVYRVMYTALFGKVLE